MILFLVAIAGNAIAKVPAKAPEADARADSRRFEIDFGEPVQVPGSKFWLTLADGTSSELEFDGASPLASKVSVYLPKIQRGKCTLSWIVESATGEPAEGELNLNLE